MRGNKYFLVIFLGFCLFGWSTLCAQSEEQEALEAKREQLQKEIEQINYLLFDQKKKKGNVLDQMEALDNKIKVRQKLIDVTNQQSNLLNKKINDNIRVITKLREELEALKDDYAMMIQKGYQSKIQQSKLMFLLSSENFYQAFKRMQYIKQYTEFRRKQGEKIVVKTEELGKLNAGLTIQRKEKERLVAENLKAKKAMTTEKKAHQELLGSIRKSETKYAAQIRDKQNQAKQIDRQIERLIREAIAASNKDSGKKSDDPSKFLLTPEAAIVANSFTANKGRLIWPVEKGFKSQGFGVYADAIYPGIKHQSNGVIITTDQGAKARAIFRGEVIAILSIPGGNKAVQLKHGNFISTYYNLSKLYVKKGDRVEAKTELGEIYTNRSNGQTKLKFYLHQNTSKLNPEEWVYQL
ncbi:peptidoglycan DD-metalloendopeptidase family protein [Zobellia galactanivorans]|uniref:murein hydrolase activator EnvC family protein n=1 Tax=Zobellia TaxID=112040 RepID=UPI000B53883E|nr:MULTISPECIES: peptidoglycan DD-metalloendopeptidase family protein [Zobellia]MBU3026649.1 peptidoglycan DD-metalloendopeptidase family protein [Zobellia galactanivorans]MDO6809211.1 peptidoglycan DD-metalloendopeptidase family protein [Zobellia galactanivorans]OWW26859.1 peptidase M23 [Zobellia sp. OII3]